MDCWPIHLGLDVALTIPYNTFSRAISSAARAPRLHRGCRGFKSLIAHCLPFQLRASDRPPVSNP